MHAISTRTRRMRAGVAARIAALSLAVLTVLGLAACAPPARSSGDAGTLVYGLVGSANDRISPWPLQRNVSQTVLGEQVFEGLTRWGADGSLQWDLAVSMEPEQGLDEWTIRLRPGVRFHDGSPLTADDVIYSIRWMIDPANQYSPATNISMVDPAGLSRVDEHTLRVRLTQPYGPFPQLWAFNRLLIARDGAGPESMIGTGPFAVASFAAQQEAVLKRFEDYWGTKPGFAQLRMLNFPDQDAMVNALRAGQIDIADAVPFTQIASLAAEQSLATLESAVLGGPMIGMRTDVAPFSDPRVREAFRLIVDRKQVLSNAFSGYGEVGNDINVRSTACAAPSVPQREQDVERAKALLAEAGVSGLNIDLTTDGLAPGMMELAQLFAQQAAKAGVTVNVRKLDVAEFVSKYREWPLAIGLSGDDYLSMIPAYYQPGGGQNLTRFDDAEYNALAASLRLTTDPQGQCALVTQMLQIQYERGGDIMPVYFNSVVVHNVRVHGLTADRNGRAAYNFRGVTLVG